MKPHIRQAVQIVAIYAVVGILWILLSDQLLDTLFGHPGTREQVEVIKGLLFVVVTAAILYGLVHRQLQQANESARQAKEKSELLQLAMRAGRKSYWMWKVESDYVRCEGDAFFAGRDMTRQELFEFIHPEDHDAVSAAFDKAMASDSFEVVLRMRSENGYRIYHSLATVLRDDLGTRLVGIKEDVTEEVEAKRQLNRFNAELEDTVALRTKQLQLANEELSSFGHSVIHDLRAPLRAISFGARVLEEDFSAAIGDEGLREIKRITRNVHSMSSLIDGLSQLTGVSRAELQLETVNAEEIARAVVDELQAGDPRPDAAIEIQPEMTIHADERLLRAVLENLIGNAYKFSGRAGHTRIRIGLKDSALFVSDEAGGFDPGQVEEVFRPFRRLNADIEGSGIGLATVARIASRHGGQAWAETTPGVGSTFYVSFAAQEKAAEATGAAAAH